MKRLHFVSSLLVVAVAMSTVAWSEEATQPSTSDSRRWAVSPLVIVGQDQVAMVCLAWAEGTGRVPQVLFSTQPVLTHEQRIAARSEPFSQNGIALSPDETAVSEVFKLMLQNKPASLPADRPKTIRAVQVRVSESAKPGTYPFHVHVVSGTARTMVLSAKIFVVVR